MSVPSSSDEVLSTTKHVSVDDIADIGPTTIEPAVIESAKEERTQLENDRLRAEVGTLEQDREERKKYAHRVFCLVVGWLATIGVIVGLQGFKTSWYSFELPTSVLITLIGSTTASVVGIFLIVATYLFPKRP